MADCVSLFLWLLLCQHYILLNSQGINGSTLALSSSAVPMQSQPVSTTTSSPTAAVSMSSIIMQNPMNQTETVTTTTAPGTTTETATSSPSAAVSMSSIMMQNLVNQTTTETSSTAPGIAIDTFKDCTDSPVCLQIPGICNSTDMQLVGSLCPQLCQMCPTTLKPTTITTTPVPTTIPAPSCTSTFCQHGGVCVMVQGKPRCACPEGYSGVTCGDAEHQTTTVSAPSSSAPQATVLDALTKEGCNRSDIVFLVEHTRGDNRMDVDHEADFIRNLVLGWNINDGHARVGVVVYGDGIRQKIDFDRSSGGKHRLVNMLENLAHREGHRGNASVDNAIRYANQNIFEKDHRDNATKVLVVLVHKLSTEARQNLAATTRPLQDQGIVIYGVGADVSQEDSLVMQAAFNHYGKYKDFNRMEASLNGTQGTHDYC